jgi:hypothetical protein
MSTHGSTLPKSLRNPHGGVGELLCMAFYITGAGPGCPIRTGASLNLYFRHPPATRKDMGRGPIGVRRARAGNRVLILSPCCSAGELEFDAR